VKLDLARIRGLVPHAGAMCLLHEVLQADADSIRARAVSHRDPANPLREGGVLPALCGAEYAAQAMAVHGSIQNQNEIRSGMLASLRDVELAVERLDDIAEDLLIEAHCLLNESGRLLYRFEVRAGNRWLLQGRATVVTQ
jgi:predicted hotdog family 3-hydroxylacyl-ACP dehydratase